MKIFLHASCDIICLCSNIPIVAKKANYNIELGNHDFETQVERHEQKGKVEEGVDKSAGVNENVHTWLG